MFSDTDYISMKFLTKTFIVSYCARSYRTRPLHKHESNSIMLAKFHVIAAGHFTSSLFLIFVQRQLVCYCVSGLCSYPMLMGQDVMTLQEPTSILLRIVDTKSICSSQKSEDFSMFLKNRFN
jgi:hypothetical protein